MGTSLTSYGDWLWDSCTTATQENAYEKGSSFCLVPRVLRGKQGPVDYHQKGNFRELKP